MNPKWLRGILTLAFVALLMGGAVARLLDSREFAESLGRWRIVPGGWTPMLAVMLTLLEFQAGVGLLAGGRRRRWGLVAATGLYVFYVFGQLQGLLRGLSSPVDGAAAVVWPLALSWGTFFRDCVVLLVALGLKRAWERRSASRGHVAPVRWAIRR